MEEFNGEEDGGEQPAKIPTQVFDLDEDGTDSLEQFGIVRRAV